MINSFRSKISSQEIRRPFSYICGGSAKLLKRNRKNPRGTIGLHLMIKPAQDVDPDLSIAKALKRPDIESRYVGYSPPFPVEKVIAHMVEWTPAEYIRGLGKVVLTNRQAQPRAVRRAVTRSRGKKVKRIEALGLYHPAHGNEPAWIEMFVDNIFGHWEKGLWLRSRVLRSSLLGDVFFHELGHHIHFTLRPEHKEREDVADVWMVRLYGKSRPISIPSTESHSRNNQLSFMWAYFENEEETLCARAEARADFTCGV